MPRIALPMLWPDKDSYARYVAVSDGPMVPDYDAFLKKNAAFIDKLAKQGVQVVKIAFDPDEMADWCRANRGAVHADDRAAYAAFVVQQYRARPGNGK